ncbi:efflux RND transporter periplasmic adaptor subunit [Thermincola ferriacetica]
MSRWPEVFQTGLKDNKKRKKWIYAGVGLLVILGLISSVAFQAVDVDTYTVQRTDVVATVWETGKVVSDSTEDIYSEIQGRVKAVYVDTGDSVEKGKLLAVIDVGELDTQIARLEGELKSVEGQEQTALSQVDSNQIKQQELAVEQARVALGLAKANYERIKELYAQGAATRVELDQSEADLATRQKAVSQAEAALASLKKQNKSSLLQYEGQRESLQAELRHLQGQKAKSRVTADRDGIVFTRKVKEGDIVSPGSLLFTVGRRGKTKIEVYVNNKDMMRVNTGDEVKVIFRVPGEDVEVKGVIDRIAPAAEEIISSLGIPEDKIKVTVNLKEKPAGIRVIPGATVDVVVTTQKATDVPAVPKEALFSDKGEDYVWVNRQGKAAIVKVQTGVEGDDLVEIKSGLKEGDRVLLNPHLPELKEGIRIK